ncbi:hypothetical protein ABK040_011936 [Willaertia magna]
MKVFKSLPKESFVNDASPYFKGITQQITCTIHKHEDKEYVVVYQAYKKAIADHAVKNQTFENCSEFDMKRMTWIKPNYLWMMYRSEFATAKNQERILALYIEKEFFVKEILSEGICSIYYPELESYYGDQAAWKKHINNQRSRMDKTDEEKTAVRVQWDPYHTPAGGKFNGGLTRAIQLGLKGSVVKKLMSNLLAIEDITEYVKEQHEYFKENKDIIIPVERYWKMEVDEISKRLGITEPINQQA